MFNWDELFQEIPTQWGIDQPKFATYLPVADPTPFSVIDLNALGTKKRRVQLKDDHILVEYVQEPHNTVLVVYKKNPDNSLTLIQATSNNTSLAKQLSHLEATALTDFNLAAPADLPRYIPLYNDQFDRLPGVPLMMEAASFNDTDPLAATLTQRELSALVLQKKAYIGSDHYLFKYADPTQPEKFILVLYQKNNAKFQLTQVLTNDFALSMQLGEYPVTALPNTVTKNADWKINIDPVDSSALFPSLRTNSIQITHLDGDRGSLILNNKYFAQKTLSNLIPNKIEADATQRLKQEGLNENAINFYGQDHARPFCGLITLKQYALHKSMPATGVFQITFSTTTLYAAFYEQDKQSYYTTIERGITFSFTGHPTNTIPGYISTTYATTDNGYQQQSMRVSNACLRFFIEKYIQYSLFTDEKLTRTYLAKFAQLAQLATEEEKLRTFLQNNPKVPLAPMIRDVLSAFEKHLEEEEEPEFEKLIAYFKQINEQIAVVFLIHEQNNKIKNIPSTALYSASAKTFANAIEDLPFYYQQQYSKEILAVQHDLLSQSATLTTAATDLTQVLTTPSRNASNNKVKAVLFALLGIILISVAFYAAAQTFGFSSLVSLELIKTGLYSLLLAATVFTAATPLGFLATGAGLFNYREAKQIKDAVDPAIAQTHLISSLTSCH